ncbi:Acyltransferase AFT15-1-like protein [Cladobotryum mycophilum]|uniref:Acyltransferase AFT15-1-like protein n=1 Tax=Cladobotryum mycophilum TaxID=491253 RepID=A0ABR0SHG9_9HYPO
MALFKLVAAHPDRIHPASPPLTEKVVALSLLDATTVNFAFTNAMWMFEQPQIHTYSDFNLIHHLRQTLAVALTAYPQWCGHLKSITSINGSTPEEASHLPSYARRFGRLYSHYGTSNDPGVEFIVAQSSRTLDELHPTTRMASQPLWDRHQASLKDFVPATAIANPLQSNNPDEAGLMKPLMAIQITQLACGGFIMAAKSTHSLADITSLIHFMKDWAKISRSTLAGDLMPSLNPIFNPALLDVILAGGIDPDEPDPALIQQAKSLPLHRYDWWASTSSCPWPIEIPQVFKDQIHVPTGPAMPWPEWDVAAPVSSYTVHLNRDQVEFLWHEASRTSSKKLSRHDAVLAHIWSCVMRARGMQNDVGPVHCDLVYGVRPTFQLGKEFMGSPIMMVNIEIPGSDVATGTPLPPIAQRIRETIRQISRPANLVVHLYSLAYEKSPQRIWQAFLGKRHILVTTWARAGIYELDFGLDSAIRYADGVVPDLDGNIVIKEAPPNVASNPPGDKSSSSWTENGVDVSIHIRTEDMQRLLIDPALLPRVAKGESHPFLSL